MNTTVTRTRIEEEPGKPTPDNNSNNNQDNNQEGNGAQGPTPPVKKKSNASKWIWTIVIFILVMMMFSMMFSTNYVGFNPGDITNLYNTSPDKFNNIFKDGIIDAAWYMTSAGPVIMIKGHSTSGHGTVIYRTWVSQWENNIGGEAPTVNAVIDAINAELAVAMNPDLVINANEAIQTTNPFWSFIFSMLPWILILGGTWWIMSAMMKQQTSVGKMNNSAMTPQMSNITFKDVAGYDEVKAELWEIVDFLKNPAKYNEVGARTPKGVLLSGPPGTGKTFFAKAVAGEASIPFYSISGSDFVEMFVGVGAKRVRELFGLAKQTAPSLIFIDELDAVGRQRGAGMGGGNDEREQTLNQMLVEMDGFAANTGIVIMAATNRPDVLDPALKRPGRFDRSIEFRMPDILERKSILEIYAKQGNKKFAEDVDWYNVSGRTPGFSAAQLENVINEAAILSIRLKRKNISLDIIDEAIDRVIGGPSKSNNLMSDEEKELIAYHEAGHALIGLALEEGEKVQKITIVPRGQAGGYVLMTPKKEKFVQTKAELKAKISSYMAGRAAEEIYFGKDNVTTGAYSDIESATQIARRMVTEFGMSDLGPIQYEKPQGSVFLGRDYGNASRNYSGQIGVSIDEEVRKLIDSAYKQAIELINANKNIMDLLAESLLIKETLTAEEAEYIYEFKKLPEQVETMKELVKQAKKDKKTADKIAEAAEASDKKEAEEKAKAEKETPAKKTTTTTKPKVIVEEKAKTTPKASTEETKSTDKEESTEETK